MKTYNLLVSMTFQSEESINPNNLAIQVQDLSKVNLIETEGLNPIPGNLVEFETLEAVES